MFGLSSVHYNAFAQADSSNGRIRRYWTNGTITTLYVPGSCPISMSIDASGNMTMADNCVNKALRISPTGAVSAVSAGDRPAARPHGVTRCVRHFGVQVAGNGSKSFVDGVAAVAMLSNPLNAILGEELRTGGVALLA